MTKPNYRNGLLLIACSVILALPATEARSEQEKPKLNLQITVDQLRGDLPGRYLDRMGDGGFQYLFKKGVVYANAHHTHANTETIVGHTTLATGATPAVHGMAGVTGSIPVVPTTFSAFFTSFSNQKSGIRRHSRVQYPDEFVGTNYLLR